MSDAARDVDELLIDAIDKHNLQGVKEALDNGAEVTRSVKRNRYVFSNILAYAAYAYDADVFQEVLSRTKAEDMDAAMIISDKKNVPILHYMSASSHSDYETQNAEIKMLLDRGYDVNKKDSKGVTAAGYACSAANLKSLKILAEHGADLDAEFPGNKRIINVLFNFDGTYFDFDYRNHYRDNNDMRLRNDEDKEKAEKDKALMKARLKDILDLYHGKNVIKSLMKDGELHSFEEAGHDANKILAEALKKGDLNKVGFALQFGADAYAHSMENSISYCSISPLEYVIDKGMTDALNLMINQGVDMNRPLTKEWGEKYSSPLFLAAMEYARAYADEEENRKMIFDKVLAATNDENVRGLEMKEYQKKPVTLLERLPLGSSCLREETALDEKYMHIFQALTERGYDVNRTNDKGHSDFSRLLMNTGGNSVQIGYTRVKLFVENGGDLDMKVGNGKLVDILSDHEKDLIERKTEMEELEECDRPDYALLEKKLALIGDIKKNYNRRHNKDLNIENMMQAKGSREA